MKTKKSQAPVKTQNPAEAGPYVDILFWIVLTAKSKFD
jgi:hypothetical protein